MKNKSVVKDASVKNKKTIGYYIPIVFIIAIIPLIVHGKVIELPIEQANFWKGGTTQIDFFNYYKSLFLIITTFAALCAYAGLFLNNKLPLQNEKKYYIPIIIYILFAVLSTINSQNKQVALEGFIEMYQGIFVLISYVILLFIIINYIQDERDINVIIYAFMALIIIEGLIGLSQYFGFDFFQTVFGRWIMSPAQLRNSNLKFTFGKFTIYGTMYNTNFVGSYGTLVLPISIILFLFSKSRKSSILYGIVSSLAFSTWLGCNSRAGYLGIFISSIFGIVILRKVIKSNFKKVLYLTLIFIIITAIFNIVSEGRVLNQITKLSPVVESNKINAVLDQQQNIRFEEVSIKENSFKIKTNKECIIGKIEDSNLVFSDEKGKKLDLKIYSDGKIEINDDKFSEYVFLTSVNKPSHIKANIYGRNWELFVTPDKNVKVISLNNKLTDPIVAPHIELFDGRETFASNRGYIWSRTIPMLKDVILIGYGPDNFPLFFPQEDYLGRFNTGVKGMLDIVIDKPHNMYLQTAINTGIVSLVSLLTIWVIYWLDSFKIYINGNINSFIEYIGASVFLSITAYLIAGFFNDSMVSIAPLFWILLGMGIAINRIVRIKTYR